MSPNSIAFAIWNACVMESDLLVVRRIGTRVELQLRGGSARLRSIVLRKSG
jgi:hypothetical protein